MKFPNQDVYIGNFKDNHFNGFGIYKWADGTEYRGNFKQSLFDGIGTLTCFIENTSSKTELKALWRQGAIVSYPDCVIKTSQ